MPAVADLLPPGCELPLIGVRTTEWTYSFSTRGMTINGSHVYISAIGHGPSRVAHKWELTIRLSGSTRTYNCSTLVTGSSREPDFLVPLVATRLLIAACWVASDQLEASKDMAQHRTLGNRCRDLEGEHGLDGNMEVRAEEVLHPAKAGSKQSTEASLSTGA